MYARFYARLARAEDSSGVAAHRRRLLAGLGGVVLEVGVGPGNSLRHYPREVERLIAVEPEPTMRATAVEAARGLALEVELVEGTAEALPAADDSVDAVVVSQVLCSVRDQAQALAEARRVLRPGGELRVYEHVRSPRAATRAIQKAFDATVWPRMMGGCRLMRDTQGAIEEAGFAFREIDHFSWGISPAAPHILGVATISGP